MGLVGSSWAMTTRGLLNGDADRVCTDVDDCQEARR